MNKSIPQFAIVREHSAQTFEEKLNQMILEHDASRKDVTVGTIGDDLYAQVEYTKRAEVVEVETPPSECGVRFTCGDCPLFQRINKEDGTPDARRKIGNCPNAFMERTFVYSHACDILYKMIETGRVALCLTDSE